MSTLSGFISLVLHQSIGQVSYLLSTLLRLKRGKPFDPAITWTHAWTHSL